MFWLWEVVNNLTRLRPTKRDRYRVTIFGSARVKTGTFAYDETKRLAAALAEMGCEIITGGGTRFDERRHLIVEESNAIGNLLVVIFAYRTNIKFT